MSVKYAAVLEEDDVRGFGVWFPDFSGCVAQGDDPLTALHNAGRALGRHIAGLAQSGAAIPQPTPAEAVELAPDARSYIMLVDADLPEAKPAYMRLNVTMPVGLVRRIDAVAGGNRSGWLAAAANEQLNRYPARTSYAASVFSSSDRR